MPLRRSRVRAAELRNRSRTLVSFGAVPRQHTICLQLRIQRIQSYIRCPYGYYTVHLAALLTTSSAAARGTAKVQCSRSGTARETRKTAASL